MVTEVTSATTAAQTASQIATSKLNTDYESFLKLLTAQLVNQDPLEPMDSTTFISQLAQLSQVEQAVQTNANLEKLTASLASNTLSQDLQLLGRSITVQGNGLNLKDGLATLEYELSDAAADVRAVIRDGSGSFLREISNLKTTAGEMHQVIWDGLDVSGLAVPDGDYSFEVIATDADGNEMSVTSYMQALVSRLTMENGQATLHLANGDTALSTDILAVQ
jgi:flagellar basal-body rod modification protein FlgD